jgi:hypothetical protein
VYLVDGPDGQPTTGKLNDTIAHNYILANYHQVRRKRGGGHSMAVSETRRFCLTPL